MTTLKDVATTLALLGSGALATTACDKTPPSTEVPGATASPSPATAPVTKAEATCAADDHPAEGHCAGAEPEPGVDASCSADKDVAADPPG